VPSTAAPDTQSEPSVVPDTVYSVPGIVVEAPRITIDDHRQSGFVATLDVVDRRHRVEDLSSVLSQMIGVRVRQYGGLGGFATVSIRGSSSNQVDVYLDGVPLNDAYTGVSNVGDLPLDGVRRVEVFRGFTPSHLGSSSMGGSINLITENDEGFGKPTLISKVEARQSYGSFETSKQTVSLWSELQRVKFFVHGGRLTSQGNFEFLNDNTTPLNTADDRPAVRLNNDFESWNALGRLFAELPALGNATVSYNAAVREGGVPGVGSFQSLTARSQRRSQLVNVQLDPQAVFWDRVQTFAGGFYSQTDERFHDPNGEIGLTPQDTDNSFQSYGGSVRARLRSGKVPVTLEAFYEAKDESFRPRQTLPEPSIGPDRGRTTQTATISGDLFLLDQNLVLSVTQRFLSQTTEFYDPPQLLGLPPSPQGKTRRNAQTPRLGFRWHPMSVLTFKGNWGRTFRQPTMLELFGNIGSVTGAAGLEPEEGENRDIGVVLALDAAGALRDVFVEVVYLDNEIDNLILFFPNSQFTSRPTNIGSARILGWEVSVSTLLFNRLRFAGNYTHLDARDTGPIPFYNGNELPGRPRDDVTLLLDYVRARWDVSYELNWIGRNYLDPANLRPVPAREIHNLALRLGLFTGWASLTGEVRNITNNQISDVNGFPLPGRSFYMTFGVTTDKDI
jgi:iron complex outermembrane receptor protein